MLASRFGRTALNTGFKTPEVERNANRLTKGGRKYVSRFDDDASSTYTEYLCVVNKTTQNEALIMAKLT
jgi:hypothetical protein